MFAVDTVVSMTCSNTFHTQAGRCHAVKREVCTPRMEMRWLTEANLSRRFSRGIRTPWKAIAPLSTPAPRISSVCCGLPEQLKQTVLSVVEVVARTSASRNLIISPIENQKIVLNIRNVSICTGTTGAHR